VVKHRQGQARKSGARLSKEIVGQSIDRGALGWVAGLKCGACDICDFTKSGYRLLRAQSIRPLPSMGNHFQRGAKSFDLAIDYQVLHYPGRAHIRCLSVTAIDTEARRSRSIRAAGLRRPLA
jgi:hypothetical protein